MTVEIGATKYYKNLLILNPFPLRNPNLKVYQRLIKFMDLTIHFLYEWDFLKVELISKKEIHHVDQVAYFSSLKM